VSQVDCCLSGNGPDNTSIEVKLLIDPVEILGWNQTNLGRGMVIPYKTNITVSRPNPFNQQLPPSLYDKAAGKLVMIFGTIFSGPWSTGLTVRPNGGSYESGLFVSLTDQDIESLEHLRAQNGQGTMGLQLVLSGLVEVTGTSISLSTNYLWAPSAIAKVENRGMFISIPRETWIGAINQLGHVRYIVELPMPEVPLVAPWAPVNQTYQQALAARQSGRYEDATSLCRKVVEGIATVLSAQWGIDSLTNKGRERSFTEWTKEIEGRLKDHAGKSSEEQHQGEMIAALLRTCWAWTSPTHHYSGKIPQADGVRFTIFLTASLLDITPHILKAHPHHLRDPRVKEDS